MEQQIVFTGRIREGLPAEWVRGNVAKLLKVSDPLMLDKLFCGAPVVLKKGVTSDQARPYIQVLYDAGLVCELRPVPGAAVSPAFSVAVAPAAPAPAPAVAREIQPAPVAAEPPEDARTGRYALRSELNTSAADAWEVGSPLPLSAEGLCWGGFFAPLLWGTFNGVALSFLPLLGIKFLRAWLPAWIWILVYLAMGSYFLVRGRELAWSRKRWRDRDHFVRVQKYWTIGGAAFFGLFMVGMINLWQADRLAARQVAAFEALAAAEELVDEDARAAAVARAREALLRTIPDPEERDAMRMEFEEMDREAAELEALEAGGSEELGGEFDEGSATGEDPGFE